MNQAEKDELTRKEDELCCLLTELYGQAVAGNRSKDAMLQEIGHVLVARKMFGTDGDSPHAQLNRALDNCDKQLGMSPNKQPNGL